jgi:putative tryptophan/tyrosine transport system substrate-binding protein
MAKVEARLAWSLAVAEAMRRRDFIKVIAGSATAWPLAAHPQQTAMPVVGILSPLTPESGEHLLDAFRRGLSETGYAEGRNVAIKYRWADGSYDRLPALAADLARRHVSIIASFGGFPAAQAAKAATATIPIVFVTGADPVQAGLVASLSRPGGNLTGVTFLGAEVGPKRLELLHELVPTATIIAVLVNPTNPVDADIRNLHAAARILGLQLHVLHASTEHRFETVFATVVQLRAGGLVINADGLFTSRSEQLAAAALRHAVPAIQPNRRFAAAGGLMSYGGSSTDQYRLLGIYTGRILKGEKPADLPVQRATKVEFVINLRTAKAFGLEVPPTLLARADEVIE